MRADGDRGPGPGACLLHQPELRAGSPGSPPLPTTEPSNAGAFPALDSAGATGPELEKSLIQFTMGTRAAQRPCVLVKAPEHLVRAELGPDPAHRPCFVLCKPALPEPPRDPLLPGVGGHLLYHPC